MIDLALLAVAGLLQIGLPARPAVPKFKLAWSRSAAGPASYRPEDKSVSTWRDGTSRTLEPAPLAIAAAAFDLGRPIVTRCVKLNNPWCIKRARWPGELGGDEEGHTAFASTEHGADAAANLLRTYYMTHGRKSALDIVRRWAPAECRVGLGGMSITLAVGGLAGTLRARYLSAQGGRSAGRPTVTRTGRGSVSVKAPRGGRVRVSIVPLPKMPSYRVPSLTSGAGERSAASASRPTASAKRQTAPAAGAPRRMASRPTAGRSRQTAMPSAVSPLSGFRSLSSGSGSGLVSSPMKLATPTAAMPSYCGSDEGRIQNYAGAIASALGLQPGGDLKLFDENGQPTINLLPVLVAMSAVELGYLHAGPTLAEGAVERLRVKLTEAAAREAAAREQNNLMSTSTP